MEEVAGEALFAMIFAFCCLGVEEEGKWIFCHLIEPVFFPYLIRQNEKKTEKLDYSFLSAIMNGLNFERLVFLLEF